MLHAGMGPRCHHVVPPAVVQPVSGGRPQVMIAPRVRRPRAKQQSSLIVATGGRRRIDREIAGAIAAGRNRHKRSAARPKSIVELLSRLEPELDRQRVQLQRLDHRHLNVSGPSVKLRRLAHCARQTIDKFHSTTIRRTKRDFADRLAARVASPVGDRTIRLDKLSILSRSLVSPACTRERHGQQEGERDSDHGRIITRFKIAL